MKTKCIIEKIEDKLPETEGRRILQKVTGKTEYPSPIYYRNLETGEEYAYIAGGLAFPSKFDNTDEIKPGVAVIVAVDEANSDVPVFRVLEEAQSENVPALLRKCLVLREKYGDRECSELFDTWRGDNKNYQSHVNDFNATLKGEQRGIYINPPPDFDSPNAFDSYAHRIRELAAKEARRLHLGPCNLLRNCLLGEINHPAVLALGYVVFSLSSTLGNRPWMKPVNEGPDNYMGFGE